MNIIQQFIRSIYSPTTIAKFRYQKIGKGILYVFFLMILATLPLAILIGTNLSHFFDKTGEHLYNTVPSFTIENGVLYTDEEEPIIVEEKNSVVIFDATGKITDKEVSQYESAFAILQNEAIINANGMLETLSYEDIDGDFTKKDVVELYESVHGIAPLLIGLFIVFMYLFATSMKFIGVTSLSIVGFFMNKKLGDVLSYKQCWVIAAYTVTLPTILFAIFDALQIDIPYSFTVYWMIAIILLYKVFKELHFSITNKSAMK